MESNFYRTEIAPIIRDIVVESIDLYGKDHRILVNGLSPSHLNRLALAYWAEQDCSKEFINETNEGLDTVYRIALRDPKMEHLADVGRITIKLLVEFYQPKMQEALDLMLNDLREQIEADEYLSAGCRQIIDEQTGEKRWIK